MPIKRRVTSLCWLTLLIFLTICPDSSHGQNKISPRGQKLPDKILAFLKAKEPKVLFRGKVIPIPEEFRQSLEVVFYLHRFNIVSLARSLDISYMETEMIIVTDAKSGEVVSYLWEGAESPPISFKELLTHYSETYDDRGAASRIKLLGDLVVYLERDYEPSMGSRVGAIRYEEKDQTFTAELIRSFAPYCFLQVHVKEIGNHYQFGRLSFIDPLTGKER